MIACDPLKETENLRKHGLPLVAAEFLFDGPFIEEEDTRADYGETRFIATGPVAPLGNRVCVAVYTWRGHIRRVVSFRKANDREVRKYQASQPGRS